MCPGAAYLALALLLMVLTVLVCGRCQRQDRQLAALLGGTTLLPLLSVPVQWTSHDLSQELEIKSEKL